MKGNKKSLLTNRVESKVRLTRAKKMFNITFLFICFKSLNKFKEFLITNAE